MGDDGVLPILSRAGDFDHAAELVLAYLCEHLPMDFWSVTRRENGRQTYLHLGENGYGLERGQSHRWDDGFCVHMVEGRAPAVVADAQSVPLYAAAPAGADLRIGAYAGARIDDPDGDVFGAICGLRKESVDDERFEAAGPLLAMLGQLLSMVLRADRERDEAERLRVTAELAAETDALTDVHNRRAWQRVLDEEQTRFARFADPTAVVVVDLDRLKEINDSEGHAAGDRALRTAADALTGAVREVDVVARLGGDEFGVLLRGCTEEQAPTAVARLRTALEEAGVSASAGWTSVRLGGGVHAAAEAADRLMYDDKRRRAAGRS